MSFQTISRLEVNEWKDKDDVQVINVLKKKHHDMMHIPGDTSIPLDELKESVWEELDEDKTYIVYCFNEDCQASPKAAEFLHEKGFNVLDYEEGIVGWANSGLPVEGELSREEFLKEHAG